MSPCSEGVPLRGLAHLCVDPAHDDEWGSQPKGGEGCCVQAVPHVHQVNRHVGACAERKKEKPLLTIKKRHIGKQ